MKTQKRDDKLEFFERSKEKRKRERNIMKTKNINRKKKSKK